MKLVGIFIRKQKQSRPGETQHLLYFCWAKPLSSEEFSHCALAALKGQNPPNTKQLYTYISVKYRINETLILNLCLHSIRALSANILHQGNCTCNVFQLSSWVRFKITAFLDGLCSVGNWQQARPWRKSYYLCQCPEPHTLHFNWTIFI